MRKLISIIIPAYNEEENIPVIIPALHQVMQRTDYDYEFIVVDDGSTDNTIRITKEMAATDNHLFYIELSRNFGKDNAMLAAMGYAKGEAIITIDSDMQHPPELIPQLLVLWEEGNDVVYAYRQQTNQHAGIINRLSSKLFYKTVNALSDIELEDGIADFRLIDAKVNKVFAGIKEVNPFFRGLVDWVGFKQKGIPYTPNARLKGETKYSKKALLKLALQGITSFSTKPLYIALYLGFAIALGSLLYIPYVIISLCCGHPVSGWASLIVTVAFLGGIQLFILGIIGLYIGKMFLQTKQRPVFIVRSTNLL